MIQLWVIAMLNYIARHTCRGGIFLRVTKDNVDMLKPGMLIKVNGMKARLTKKGDTAYKLSYEFVGGGHGFIDIEHMELPVELLKS